MNPCIIHPPGREHESVLIDRHSEVFAENVKGLKLPAGKLARVALKAVAIKNLKVGEITTINGHVYPRPCQVAVTSNWQIKKLGRRGIFTDAAAAMLSLNHGMNTLVAPEGDFVMGKETNGFDHWHLLIAWAWSSWQDKHRRREGGAWPLKRRWEEMKAIGYPGKEGSFRQVCSRLNLSVTKSKPSL